jgi:hypothetical protein
MSRVPVKYQKLVMLDEAVQLALRKPGQGLPRRPRKIYDIARAEGVYGRWIYPRDLRLILDRHHTSPGTTAAVAWYLNRGELSREISGVPHYFGLEPDKGEGIVEIVPSWVPRDLCMQIVQELRFSLGCHGLSLITYPLTREGYALVRVLDRSLVDGWENKDWEFEHQKRQVCAFCKVHVDLPDGPVVSGEEFAAIMGRDPAKVSGVEGDEIARLEREVAEIERQLASAEQ